MKEGNKLERYAGRTFFYFMMWDGRGGTGSKCAGLARHSYANGVRPAGDNYNNMGLRIDVFL